MKKQFQHVRHFVQDTSSRLAPSNVFSSLSNLATGKHGDKDTENLANSSSSVDKKLFGVSLDEHLTSSGRSISVVIESCIAFLLDYMEEEGLFRIPGSTSEVKRLKSGFEAGIHDLTDRVRDPHAVAGTLKSYLRELPDPLLTHSLYEDWMVSARETDLDERMQSLHSVCHRLPQTNFQNLRYLIRFLDKLAQSSDTNKMSSQNIAMSLTPSLIWTPFDSTCGQSDLTTGLLNGPTSSLSSASVTMDMTSTNLHSVIVYSLVSNAGYFFPEEITFTSLTEFCKKERSWKPNPAVTSSSGASRPKSSLFRDSSLSRDSHSVTFNSSADGRSDAHSVSFSSLVRRKKDRSSTPTPDSRTHKDLHNRSNTPVVGHPPAVTRKAPKKPAPPAPHAIMTASLNDASSSPSLLRKTSFGSSSLSGNNNNEGLPDSWSSRQSPSLKTFASRLSVSHKKDGKNTSNTGINSSNETLECSSDSSSHSSSHAMMTSSMHGGYDTRSLDRREILRRNNSDKSSTASPESRINRKTHIFRRSLMPVQRPSVPPPTRPPRPDQSSIERQTSMDDILTKEESHPETDQRTDINRSHDDGLNEGQDNRSIDTVDQETEGDSRADYEQTTERFTSESTPKSSLAEQSNIEIEQHQREQSVNDQSLKAKNRRAPISGVTAQQLETEFKKSQTATVDDTQIEDQESVNILNKFAKNTDVAQSAESSCQPECQEKSQVTTSSLPSEGIPKKPPRRNKQSSSSKSPQQQHPQVNKEDIPNQSIIPREETSSQYIASQQPQDRERVEELYLTNPFVDSGVDISDQYVIEGKRPSRVNPFLVSPADEPQSEQFHSNDMRTCSSTDGSLDELDEGCSSRSRDNLDLRRSSSSSTSSQTIPVPKPRKPPRRSKESSLDSPVNQPHAENKKDPLLDIKDETSPVLLANLSQEVITQVDLYDNNNLPSPPEVVSQDCLRNNTNKPPKPLPPPKPRIQSMPPALLLDSNPDMNRVFF